MLHRLTILVVGQGELDFVVGDKPRRDQKLLGKATAWQANRCKSKNWEPMQLASPQTKGVFRMLDSRVIKSVLLVIEFGILALLNLNQVFPIDVLYLQVIDLGLGVLLIAYVVLYYTHFGRWIYLMANCRALLPWDPYDDQVRKMAQAIVDPVIADLARNFLIACSNEESITSIYNNETHAGERRPAKDMWEYFWAHRSVMKSKRAYRKFWSIVRDYGLPVHEHVKQYLEFGSFLHSTSEL